MNFFTLRESKMKRKTIATIISMFTILFIFSSMSHAITPTDWVNAHNKYRRMHVGTPDVTWDNALAQAAQDRVNKVKGNSWSHTPGKPENGRRVKILKRTISPPFTASPFIWPQLELHPNLAHTETQV
jgi:hypothetical protein